MGALAALIFEQLDKVVPERIRTRILACLSFLGLCAMIYVNSHTFAKKEEVVQLRNDVRSQIDSAVQPLASQADQRWISQLDSSILQAAAKCKETKSDEAKHLYAANLVKLLEEYQKVTGKTYPVDMSRSCQ